MPLILPANTLSDAGYDIANSCRFNRADSDTLSRTLASGSSTTKFTLSFWFKAYTLSGTARFFHCDGTRDTYMRWNSSGTVEIGLHDNSGDVGAIITNRLFRDPSSWMHFVVRFDSTESAENDRFRFYVNGVDERGVGGYSTDTMPDADDVCQVNLSGNEQHIGGKSAQYVDGYLAEMILSMGYSYAPTEFGEFDDDSPAIWKPKEFGGTIGTNGFYLDFEASGNLGNDANGGTDLTETNVAAVDQCTDSPTNNFCTLNPIDSFYRATWGGYTEGNTVATTSSTGGDYAYATTTIGLTAGKWYWEQKIITESGSAPNYDWVGVTGRVPINDTDYVGKHATGYGYLSDDNIYNNNSATDNWGDTFGANDIMSVALDLDNLKLYFAKNGTWQNSGDPTTGATGTGAAYTVTAVASTPAGAYFPTCGDYAGGAGVYAMNFGNPSYANSSDAADANGYGKFEYAPPSGYLAICTKNLASDGG